MIAGRAGRVVPAVAFEVGDLRDWSAPDGRSTSSSPTPPSSGSPTTSTCCRGWWRGAPGRLVRVPGAGQLRRAEPHHPHASWPPRRRTPQHTAGAAAPSSHDAATYLRALHGLGCEVDAWETTYLHVLHGEDPVFTWVSGTGARPTLQALPDDLRPRFEAEFKRRLRQAYPDDGHGVVLPFRRVFVVARSVRHEVHHVQVACTPGVRGRAQPFYAEGLG